MCTAVAWQTSSFYFGRTLDLEHSYGEEVTITPRKFPMSFRCGKTLAEHFAFIGMAHIESGYPLYYDAMNEKGLAMAGLNFPASTFYQEADAKKHAISHFELIPWVLAQCETVDQVRNLLKKTVVTGQSFSDRLPTARLHWLVADRKESITIEVMKEGLVITGNPVGVLTNEPPFQQQLTRLADYMQLSPMPPENHMIPGLSLQPYSRGMGAMGLPGDFSSPSRFVRTVFVKTHSLLRREEAKDVSQFFHILGAVDQPLGCCQLENGTLEHTIYTSCCSAQSLTYYFKTYDSHTISAINLKDSSLDTAILESFPVRI